MDVQPLVDVLRSILSRVDQSPAKRPREELSSDTTQKTSLTVGAVSNSESRDVDKTSPSSLVKREPPEEADEDELPETPRTVPLAFASIRNPFQCELLTKSSKGYYESRYADVPLATVGCTRCFDSEALPGLSKQGRRSCVGRRVCFLRLGTSLVVTGTIVDAEPHAVQIAPDKGQHVSIEWVALPRVYDIPDDVALVRRRVREAIVEVLNSDTVTV